MALFEVSHGGHGQCLKAIQVIPQGTWLLPQNFSDDILIKDTGEFSSPISHALRMWFSLGDRKAFLSSASSRHLKVPITEAQFCYFARKVMLFLKADAHIRDQVLQLFWTDSATIQAADHPVVAEALALADLWEQLVQVSHPFFHPFKDEWQANPLSYDTVVKVWLIWRLNGWNAKDPVTDAKQEVLQRSGSRLNHACGSCANTARIEQGNFVTTRQIEPGEELTVSYFSPEKSIMPTYMRQQMTWDRYVFKCSCARCMAPDVYRALPCPTCPGNHQCYCLEQPKGDWVGQSCQGTFSFTEIQVSAAQRAAAYESGGHPPLLQRDPDLLPEEAFAASCSGNHALTTAAIEEAFGRCRAVLGPRHWGTLNLRCILCQLYWSEGARHDRLSASSRVVPHMLELFAALRLNEGDHPTWILTECTTAFTGVLRTVRQQADSASKATMPNSGAEPAMASKKRQRQDASVDSASGTVEAESAMAHQEAQAADKGHSVYSCNRSEAQKSGPPALHKNVETLVGWAKLCRQRIAAWCDTSDKYRALSEELDKWP